MEIQLILTLMMILLTEVIIWTFCISRRAVRGGVKRYISSVMRRAKRLEPDSFETSQRSSVELQGGDNDLKQEDDLQVAQPSGPRPISDHRRDRSWRRRNRTGGVASLVEFNEFPMIAEASHYGRHRRTASSIFSVFRNRRLSISIFCNRRRRLLLFSVYILLFFIPVLLLLRLLCERDEGGIKTQTLFL